MPATIRHFAAAFTIGASIAVAIGVLLPLLTGSIRITAPLGPPWWAAAVNASVWIALGLVIWLSAPLLGDWIDDLALASPKRGESDPGEGGPGAAVPRRTAWELVGLLMMVLPVGHLVATWIVLGVQFSVGGTWASEGGIFLSGAYYGTVLLRLTPWIGGGVIVRAWARHMIAD